MLALNLTKPRHVIALPLNIFQVFVSQKPGDGLKRYSYDDLPERYHKKYLYASQFVYLVQSKTPKVTFYSPQAKCMLMENVPNPDCEVCFYNGPKVHFTEQHVKLIDACGGLHTMTSPSLSGLSDDSQRLLSHAQECKAKCKAIQSTMEELSRTAGCYENFPVIVGRRPTPIASKPSPSQDDVTASGTSTKLTNSGNAVSPSTVAVNTASVKSYDTMMSEQLIRRVFVPNVGWASQMNNHNIHIDYNDGSQLQINSDVTRVTYLTAEGQKTNYCQGESIPNYVKTKLAQLPKAVEKLQDQTATSSLTQGIVYASEGSRLTTKKQ